MTETAQKPKRNASAAERKPDGFVAHNMTDYEETYSTFSIPVPEYYNFGFDVVDAWAKKDRNKLAMIGPTRKEKRNTTPSAT